MSDELTSVMQRIRLVLAAKRAEAASGLEQFANEVAEDAAARAPVRKLYANRPGKRESSSDVPERFYQLMARYAERTSYRDKSGKMVSGYLSPNYRVRNRNRKVQTKNNIVGEGHVLGYIDVSQAKVPTYAETKTIFGSLYWRGSRQGHRQVAHLPQEKGGWQRVYTPTFKPRAELKGKLSMGVGYRNRELGPQVTSVSGSFLKELTPDARTALRTGKGLRIEKADREGHYRVIYGGRLRNSIIAEKVDDLTYTVAAHVPYAKYVEFGTRYAAAQPFLIPAMYEARQKMKTAVVEYMKRG